jgi:23S rRNA G2445 N2-methylase RlmL
LNDDPASRGTSSGGVPAELERCLREAGYTPPLRAIAGLVAALPTVADEAVQPLARALVRAGTPALHAVQTALPTRPPDQRPRLVGLLARFASELEDAGLYPALLSALDEPLVESRKLAARGLGKLADPRAEPRLLEAFDRATGAERKNIIDALAALGTEASVSRLSTLRSDDPDLERRRARAQMLIERRASRVEPSSLAFDRALGSRFRMALTCRKGLADLLVDELSPRWQPERRADDRVDVVHAGTLGELLIARTALEVALVVAPAPAQHAPPQWRIARALSQPETVAALKCWTNGVPRFRVAWTAGGHHRALSWALARELRECTTDIVNDSQAARWTLRAAPDASGDLLLVPRLDPDPRFDYRRADVPAASHPTIAAALARFAGIEADEVVWDPFVGSGLELIERARLGPVRALYGTDLDPRALAAARQNLEAAGISGAQLIEADALTFSPPRLSLIISNPPMGRRVARDGSVGQLLERFVTHAATVLRPGGRLVWLSPLGRRTEKRARDLGLTVTSGPEVDLGGFTASLQRFTRSR